MSKAERRIQLDQIDIPQRLRPIDASAVEMIAASFEESGQKTAILLRPKADRYELVAGAHRMAAAALLGWTSIRADVEDLDDNHARLAEIDENLMRRELNPLDRAIFLLERKKIYEALHPETAHGKAPKNKVERLKAEADGEKSQTLRLFFPQRFTAEAAAKVGLSERAIQLAIAIAEGLSPKAIEAMRGTALEHNQQALVALTELPASDQVRAVKRVASGEARNLSEAKVQLGLATEVVRDEQARIQTQLMALWEKANRRVRTAFLQHIEAEKKGK